MENTDAKVFLMINDLSREALLELLGNPEHDPGDTNHLKQTVRVEYEAGAIPAEEIIAAWNDDTWNGVD